MSTQVQHRRGTQAENDAFTGAAGEFAWATDTKRIAGHDGSTAGGVLFGNHIDIIKNYFRYATCTGTDTIVATLPYSPGAYTAGMEITIMPANTNTGAATVNVNTLGAKTIKKVSSGALADVGAGDIIVGIPTKFIYDGTYMVLQGSASSSGLAIIASGNLATGSPTVVDITGIPQNYKSLHFYIDGASNSVATRALRVSADTGSGLGNVANAASYSQIDGSGTPTTVSGAAAGLMWTGVTQTAAQVSSCILNFPAYQSGPIKSYNGSFATAASSGNNFANASVVQGILVNASQGARTGGIVGIRATWDNVTTGVFDAGTYALYGVL